MDGLDQVFYLGAFVNRAVLHGVLDLEIRGIRLTAKEGLIHAGPPDDWTDQDPPPDDLTDEDRVWLRAHRWHLLDLLARTA